MGEQETDEKVVPFLCKFRNFPFAKTGLVAVFSSFRCSDVRDPFGADPQKNPQALRERSPPNLFEKCYTSGYTRDASANVNRLHHQHVSVQTY